MNKSIEYLWEGIQRGDERAFDSLFRELFPFLLNFAHRILKNMPEAEETVQDAFINLWQRKDTIFLKDSLKSYLYQTVHNLAINKLEHTRTHKYQPNRVMNAEQWKCLHNLYSVNDTFINRFEALETEALILKAIEKLPDKCRKVFLLSRYENLTYEEISDKLTISQNTVRVQIFRALEILRKLVM